MRNINDLHEWDKNPRSIEGKDFERLKRQIKKLGQYKPIIITPDGTVLGGNMRLKAYKELGVTSVWVSIVEPKNEDQKLEYALSDNDRAGFYDPDLLANLMPNYTIDWTQYAVDLNAPMNIDDILRNLGGTPNVDDMWKEMPDYGGGSVKPAKTLYVHFQNLEDIPEFAKLVKQNVTETTKYIWYPYKPKENIKAIKVKTEEK